MDKHWETYALTGRRRHGRFLNINDNGIIWGGGSQYWFNGGRNNNGILRSAKGSCGVIAAANTAAYIFTDDEDSLGSFSKTAYMKLANCIYDYYLTPLDVNKMFFIKLFKINVTLSMGILPVTRFINGFIKFAKDRGHKVSLKTLHNNTLSCTGSFERASRFIKESLKADKPVVIFISHNKSARTPGSADWHYMVITQITEYYENKKLTGAKTVVSSWGVEREIDFKSIWNDSVFFRLGNLLKRNPVTRHAGEFICTRFCSVCLISVGKIQ